MIMMKNQWWRWQVGGQECRWLLANQSLESSSSLSSKSRVSSRWWCPGPSSWRGSSRWCWPSGNTRRPTGACERSPSVEAGSSKPGQALGFFSRSKKRIARPRMCYTLFVMRMAMSSYCVKFNCQVERMFNRRGWVNLDMPCRLNILSTQLESKC